MTTSYIENSANLIFINFVFDGAEDFKQKVQEINAKEKFNLTEIPIKIQGEDAPPPHIIRDLMSLIPVGFKDNQSTRLEYFANEKKVHITNDLNKNPKFTRLKNIAEKLINKRPSEFEAVGFNFTIVREFDSKDSFPLLKRFENDIQQKLSKEPSSFDFKFKVKEDSFTKLFAINRVILRDNEEKIAYSIKANYNFNQFPKTEKTQEIGDFIIENIINKIDEYYENYKQIMKSLTEE